MSDRYSAEQASAEAPETRSYAAGEPSRSRLEWLCIGVAIALMPWSQVLPALVPDPFWVRFLLLGVFVVMLILVWRARSGHGRARAFDAALPESPAAFRGGAAIVLLAAVTGVVAMAFPSWLVLVPATLACAIGVVLIGGWMDSRRSGE